MFHLSAYFSSATPTATPVALPALADTVLTVRGNDILVPNDLPYVLGAFAIGTTLTRAYIQSPSMLKFLFSDIEPFDLAAIPASPHKQRYLVDDPLPLVGSEPLDFYASGTSGAGENDTGLVWFCDGVVQPVTGDIRTLRATSATTLVVNTWTNCALTLSQQLPQGIYALVGARARSTNMQAFRFVLPGQVWRPGGLGAQAITHINQPAQRFGGLGEWGRFNHINIPTVDVLSNVADTAQVFDLDVIKVG